ncbi:fimbrial assembly protein [Frateuria sp. Soil773]|uniref:PilN domain-containing protein n=1 Tax=Frateuria sp. Soil773 TaxID=1736407 RepID=UPI0006FB0363|nr:PilN domain-containing protein [Frateuria sp. Soil773]KRE94888.1 fimbrial assembly protein [Frateuria sp. Soil773]
MSTAVQSLRPQLDRVRRAWRGSPLPGFFRWWGDELAALLPASWRAALRSGSTWFLLGHADGHWQLRHAGAAEPLARWSEDAEPAAQRALLDSAVQAVDREDRRLALVLPASVALRRQLSLPLAAAQTLQQVGAFEMDRQTPFRVEQVHYAIRELAVPAPPGRLLAELVAVPRNVLDPLLARLQAAEIRVDAVDVASGQGRLGVNLLPPGQAPRHVSTRRRLNLALAAGCVVLLALVLGEWLHNRQQALAAMQTEVEAMRAEAQQVAALRQQWQDNAGAAGFLVQRKQSGVTRLAVLEELTERLPDTAWLERVSIDNSGQLGFQGQSQQAAKLIDTLKGSTLITNPNFQGSIQPDPATGKERFYMVAQLRQPSAPAAGAPAASASAADGAP